jgi:hypothetical protein
MFFYIDRFDIDGYMLLLFVSMLQESSVDISLFLRCCLGHYCLSSFPSPPLFLASNSINRYVFILTDALTPTIIWRKNTEVIECNHMSRCRVSLAHQFNLKCWCWVGKVGMLNEYCKEVQDSILPTSFPSPNKLTTDNLLVYCV